MRLLETSVAELGDYTLRFKDFLGSNLPPYAILSHTWIDGEEVLFADVVNQTASTRDGLQKVERILELARLDGYEYAWVDTCCINKDSSAELSEAINSMYIWYQKAGVCYAYLADVDTDADGLPFEESRWFARGWTLQELLAPRHCQFYSRDWVFLGDKTSLCTQIESTTRIDADILLGNVSVEVASIAQRMSWAAWRQTTRDEDRAYCLMGIFSVNMPLLYGEGNRAFIRLQEEIMRQSEDHSLFAWVIPKPHAAAARNVRSGLLAESPDYFREAGSIVPYSSLGDVTPYGMTNRGLQIEVHVDNLYSEPGGTSLAALNCPDSTMGGFLAIYLSRHGEADNQFVRVRCHQLASVKRRGERAAIYVPQRLVDPASNTVYPLHVFHLVHAGSYQILDNVNAAEFDKTERTLLSSYIDRYNLSTRSLFKIVRVRDCVSAMIVLGLRTPGRNSANSTITLYLGSRRPFEVGFDAALGPGTRSILEHDYTPQKPGSTIRLPRHDVTLRISEDLSRGVKIYRVAVEIELDGVTQCDGEIEQVKPRSRILRKKGWRW